MKQYILTIRTDKKNLKEIKSILKKIKTKTTLNQDVIILKGLKAIQTGIEIL